MARHVEDFAAQLRELKDRSGRSYGTLATRLHMSTSTLHRYCNGAAVPGEYAPVERLARLCGATPEELVTLHRRWLLADAERRKEPERAESAEAAAPPENSAQSDQAEESSQSDQPEQPEQSEQLKQPEPPEPEQAVDSMPETAPRPGRPWRRKLAIPGAVTAVAAVAALTPLVLHSSDSGHPATSSASSPTPQPKAQPVPVTVDVLADNWDTECGQWFYATQPPAKVSPPPGLPDVGLWSAPLGAIPANHLRLQVTAQGVAGQPPVVLHTFYVHVVAAKPAPKGYGYTMGSGCGGGLDPASFAVNLDAAAPRAQAVAGQTASGTVAVSDFPFQVSPVDSQVLNVDAGTANQDVSWYLELVWSCGNRQGTLRVDDHGKPFRTIGLTGDPLYFYDGTQWSTTTLQ